MMPLLRRHTGPAATASALCLLMGCEPARVGDASGSPTRLLTSSDLQAVVERQVARDARALVRLLSDRDPSVRARAAFGLATLQDQTQAGALIEALADPVAAVRADAAFAIGQLPQQAQAIDDALLGALATETELAVRRRLVEALGKVGRAPASERLAEVDPDSPHGADAALALGRALARGLATPPAVDTLLARLMHTDPAVREHAAWGIANAFRESTWTGRREVVFRALDGYDRSDEAASQLLRALGKLEDPLGRSRIVDWLGTSPVWRIRAAAAEGLGGTESADEQAALLRALDDRSAHVRGAAAAGLAQAPLSEPELERLQDWVEAHPEDLHTTGALLRPLAESGRSAVVLRWIRALTPEDETGWRQGIEAAALLPGEEASRVLAEASRTPSVAISGAAVRVLVRRWDGDRSDSALHSLHYDALVEALGDGDPVLARLLPLLLADSVFRKLGSEQLLGEARAAAEAQATAESEPAVLETPDWALLRELGPRPRLTLETEHGAVVVELFAEEAPVTVQTLARLAREGQLDGTPFHRVLPNFMAQGGDVARGDGLGDPGFRIPSELTRLRYLRGTAGMARTEKDTENSQFFITHSMQPHLDGAYTAFGRVVEGMEAVDLILEGDRVLGARVEADARAP